MGNCLEMFDGKTAEWFRETLGEPTRVQEASWPAIRAGGHVLVSAPTGTGKTLSAFLVFLDQMKREAEEGRLPRELRVIYVSPLKSLAGDIRENLKRPLEGIGGEELISVAVRTGDTTQQERRRMVRKPPHILIITPESLYLMLTSVTGQRILSTARAVIVDELHALIDTKRGAHLMLSLARLDALRGEPLQRIGLSATIAPLEEAARYLAPEAVTVAAPVMEKKVELQILGSYADSGKRRKDPVWQELAALVYRYCQESRSVLAFVEGRRYAEKLAYYVNLLGGEDFARVHHGSLSKEQRQAAEQELREGRLRLLCATSSMELGIDVGEIDQVLQVGCPRTVSGTMQRLGRAGHNPSRVSVMYLFPRTAAEAVLCGMTAQLAREGEVERLNPPEGCFDVLAQHLVSMAAFRGYEIDEVMELLPRAWPFRRVTREDVRAVVGMLAGDYEHRRDVPARSRILYDRIHERVEGDGYSRLLAVSAGGTIPDKGLYTVRTEEGVKVGEADEEFVYETQRGDRFILGAFAWRVTDIGRDTVTVTQAPVEGARLPFWKGELKGRNKETGAAFGRILGRLQSAWEGGRLMEALGELGLDRAASELACGYLERQIKAAGGLPDDRTILAEHFRDQSGNSQLMIHSVFGRRINAPLALLAAREAQEEMGENVGSVDEEDGFLLYSYGEKRLPEGLLYRIAPDTSEAVLSALLPAAPVFHMAFRYNCGRALMMGARRNGRQPLWMQRLRSAELLDQVVREKDHPLIRETRRECMEQIWDGAGVREILEKIQSGEIAVREICTETPSPMSLPLQWAQEAAVMYDYAPTPQGIHSAVEEALKQERELVRPGLAELSQVQERGRLPEDERQLHALLMTEGDLAAGELDIPVGWLESLASQGRAVYLEQGLWIAAEQEEEYLTVLGWEAIREGAGTEGDVAEMAGGSGPGLPESGQFACAAGAETVAGLKSEQFTGVGTAETIGRWKSGQCAAGSETAGNSAEMPGDSERVLPEEVLRVVRRMLRYRGGSSARQTALRYSWSEPGARAVLTVLCRRGEAVAEEVTVSDESPARRENSMAAERPGLEESLSWRKNDAAEGGMAQPSGSRRPETVYYHAGLYKRARVRTVKNRREEIVTCPASSYAALLASRLCPSAPPEEGMRAALSSLAGAVHPAAAWEDILFPARVKGYRENLLDRLLAAGEYFWRMEEGGRIRFDSADQIDWEKEPEIPWEELTEKERLLARALARRGASFPQALNAVLGGESPYDTLLSLMEKGIARADSFVPARQWLNRSKTKNAAARQRMGARVKLLRSGRWDLARPPRPLTSGEMLDRCFDRYHILCRETAAADGLSWPEALSLLRVQEYTGQARRGYFVKGLSGAQFIRRKDFGGITAALLSPRPEIRWLNAADPMQPWGKLFPHEPGRAFLNVPGTVVALRGGRPAAVLERQGKTLRVFEPEALGECLRLFVEEYRQGRLYPSRKRIVIKDYPEELAEHFAGTGFQREMKDYALYR